MDELVFNGRMILVFGASRGIDGAATGAAEGGLIL